MRERPPYTNIKREICLEISGPEINLQVPPQNMTDAQRNVDISEICSELRDFSVNQVVTSPSAINSFTRRAEARLHDLAVEIEGRYPGDSQKQQEEFQKKMVPVAREELRSCVIREALSGRHTMINRGYLEKSEVYQDIEDGFMEEYFRVRSLNNINGYLQNVQRLHNRKLIIC